jgi:hypothetical protein
MHILHVFWRFNTNKRFAYRDARRYACVKFNLPASFHISRNAPPDTCAHTKFHHAKPQIFELRAAPAADAWKLCVDASHF